MQQEVPPITYKKSSIWKQVPQFIYGYMTWIRLSSDHQVSDSSTTNLISPLTKLCTNYASPSVILRYNADKNSPKYRPLLIVQEIAILWGPITHLLVISNIWTRSLTSGQSFDHGQDLSRNICHKVIWQNGTNYWEMLEAQVWCPSFYWVYTPGFTWFVIPKEGNSMKGR